MPIQQTDTTSRAVYTLAADLHSASALESAGSKAAFDSQNGSLVVQVQTVDASMCARGEGMKRSYRDNIWSQAVIENIGLEYEQSQNPSKGLQIRNLFVVIDSCVLNQLEKNRQRHVEKNILEIPKVKLRMTEEVSMEKRKTVQITVGAEKRTDG